MENKPNEQISQTTNNVTELVFILDKSGSMAGLENDTIGGFNSMIEKQKEVDGEVFVTTVLFSTFYEKLHNRTPLSEIKPLTTRDYIVGGGTALLDAVGNTIEHFNIIHTYARKEDVPSKTIFIITTDGEENASCRFSYAQIKELISKQKEEKGWEFIFAGANIDAESTADRMGIHRDRAIQYNANTDIHCCYETIDNYVSSYRMDKRLEKKLSKLFDERKKNMTKK